VPVLITSCHVSEKWNIGPVIAHTTTVPRARAKTQGRLTSLEGDLRNFSKQLARCAGPLGRRVEAWEPFFLSEVLGTV
jgi:hypothetical protein